MLKARHARLDELAKQKVKKRTHKRSELVATVEQPLEQLERHRKVEVELALAKLVCAKAVKQLKSELKKAVLQVELKVEAEACEALLDKNLKRFVELH